MTGGLLVKEGGALLTCWVSLGSHHRSLGLTPQLMQEQGADGAVLPVDSGPHTLWHPWEKPTERVKFRLAAF